MPNTFTKLKDLRTERGSNCVYSIATRQLSAFDHGKFLGTVALTDEDIVCLQQSRFDTNRSYPIGYYLQA